MLKFIFFFNFFLKLSWFQAQGIDFSTSKVLTSGSAGDPAACGTVLASAFAYVVGTMLRKERVRISHGCFPHTAGLGRCPSSTHHSGATELAQFLIQLLAYIFSTAVKLPRLRDLSSLPQGPCRRC